MCISSYPLPRRAGRCGHRPLRNGRANGVFVGEAGKMGALRGGVGVLPTPSGVWGCGARCVVRRGRVWKGAAMGCRGGVLPRPPSSASADNHRAGGVPQGHSFHCAPQRPPLPYGGFIGPLAFTGREGQSPSPTKGLSNPCVSRTLNRRWFRQGRRTPAGPAPRYSRSAACRCPTTLYQHH